MGALQSYADNWESTVAYSYGGYGELELNGIQDQNAVYNTHIYTGTNTRERSDRGASTATPVLTIDGNFGQDQVTLSRSTEADNGVSAAVDAGAIGEAAASVGVTTCRTTALRVMVLP